MKKLVSILCVVSILVSVFNVTAYAAFTKEDYSVSETEGADASEYKGFVYGYVGDVDANDIVTIQDVTVIQMHLAQLLELRHCNWVLGDVDFSGEISISDATDIQLWLAELKTDAPVYHLVADAYNRPFHIDKYTIKRIEGDCYYSPSYYLYECKCGNSYTSNKEYKEHNYGDWEVWRYPTYENTGSEVRTCYECGYVDGRDIPVLQKGNIEDAIKAAEEMLPIYQKFNMGFFRNLNDISEAVARDIVYYLLYTQGKYEQCDELYYFDCDDLNEAMYRFVGYSFNWEACTEFEDSRYETECYDESKDAIAVAYIPDTSEVKQPIYRVNGCVEKGYDFIVSVDVYDEDKKCWVENDAELMLGYSYWGYEIISFWNLFTIEDYEKHIFNEINKARAEYGLHPYEWKEELLPAVRVRAEEHRFWANEGEGSFYAHSRPNGDPWITVLDEFGLDYWSKSECLALTPYGENVCDMWLSSTAGHREAVLDPDYLGVAIGVVQDENGYYYACGIFVGEDLEW